VDIQKNISFVLILFFFTGIANASFLNTEPGWPRLVDNNTEINNTYQGIYAHFEAENKSSDNGRGAYFKEGPSDPRVAIDNPVFETWADIRQYSDGSLELLDGEFKAYGSLELDGNNMDGLLFSASLIEVDWDELTIAFLMESDQQGYLCDLGFCSFANELLKFNLKTELFDGDFTRDFLQEAQTIATVPVPAAFWLFGTAMLGLVLRRSNITTETALS